jgi:hypothetical protein
MKSFKIGRWKFGASFMPYAGLGIDCVWAGWDVIPQVEVEPNIYGADLSDKAHKWVFSPRLTIRIWNVLLFVERK